MKVGREREKKVFIVRCYFIYIFRGDSNVNLFLFIRNIIL